MLRPLDWSAYRARLRRFRRRDPGVVRFRFFWSFAWALARPCFTDRRPRPEIAKTPLAPPAQGVFPEDEPE